MEAGLLLIRLVVGLVLAARGAQKLFGAFGGGGPRATTDGMAALGYRWPALAALGAGALEFTGGLLFAAGLATPIAAAGLVIVMLNAIAVVHLGRGLLAGGAAQLPLVLIGVSLGIVATGPGRLSLDRALGWDERLSGVPWAAAALAFAVLVTFFAITWGRARPEGTELAA
jgi:putative oxidoreductase